jgi:hypothetical protein
MSPKQRGILKALELLDSAKLKAKRKADSNYGAAVSINPILLHTEYDIVKGDF